MKISSKRISGEFVNTTMHLFHIIFKLNEQSRVLEFPQDARNCFLVIPIMNAETEKLDFIYITSTITKHLFWTISMQCKWLTYNHIILGKNVSLVVSSLTLGNCFGYNGILV